MSETVLLAVDNSKNALAAVASIGRLLKDQSDCRLLLFHCSQPLTSLSPGEVSLTIETDRNLGADSQKRHATAVLELGQQTLIENGFPADRVSVWAEYNGVSPADAILDAAEKQKIRTIALGRRGVTQMSRILLGSVSHKVAQYGRHRTVWVVDTPVHETRKILVAVEGVPHCRALTYYVSELIAPIPDLHFTLLHLVPRLPPTFWDDGHILDETEQGAREHWKSEWRAEWRRNVDKFLSEARDHLIHRGVPADHIETRIQPTRDGVARDLLSEIDKNRYQLVLIGKRSFHQKKGFMMGGNANKILQNAKGVLLGLVDTP